MRYELIYRVGSLVIININKMKKFILLTTIFASAISIDSYAAPAKKTISLDTVTVVATRTERDTLDVPNMVSVVNSNAPSKRTATRTADLFRDTAGVEFGGGPVRSGETPTMRGYDADGILTLVDGKRQNFEPQHSSKFFLDPSLVKKVEVVKGPSSASYGTGAIGGVIAFVTKDAKDFAQDGQTSGGQVSFSGQTANHEYGETLTGYKLGDNYDAVASILRRDSGNINQNNDSTQRADDGLTSGMAKVTYDVDQYSTLKFDVSSFYNQATENGNPQTVDPAQDNLVDKNIISNQAGIKYTYKPDNKHVDFSTQLYYVDTAINEEVVESTDLTATGDELIRNMRTIGFNADNKSIVSIGGEDNNTFAYGVEVYQNTQDGDDSDSGNNSGLSGGRPGVPDAKSIVAGIYLQDEVSFDVAKNAELIVTPGGRFDYYNNEPRSSSIPSDTEYNFSPKLGSTLKLYNNYSLFSNYAEAFRAPNLTELYASGRHFGVDPAGAIPLLYNNFVQNPNLKPETSRTFEFGGGFNFNDLAQKDDELRVKLSRYITHASDYIEQFITGPNFGSGACLSFPFNAVGCNFGTTGFRNVTSANIWGYELDSTYENTLLEAGFNLSYVSAENARSGQFLSSKQPLIVNTNLGYKVDSLDSTIGVTAKFVDGLDKALVDTSDPNFTLNYKRGGFATEGVYWNYEPKKHKNISVGFAVDNIFDKKYRLPFSEIYDMERNYRINVTYKW